MKAMVVVDMQNDFVNGSLGSEEAIAITQKVADKILDFSGLVIATYDTHDTDYLKTQEGKFLPVEHCLTGTDGWQLVDAVRDAVRKRQGTYKEFYKPTFGSVEMAEWLSQAQTFGIEVDEIELVGVCTDICVISNALLLKAYFPNILISVDASCCAGVTSESHENALKAMNQCQVVIKNWKTKEDCNALKEKQRGQECIAELYSLLERIESDVRHHDLSLLRSSWCIWLRYVPRLKNGILNKYEDIITAALNMKG